MRGQYEAHWIHCVGKGQRYFVLNRWYLYLAPQFKGTTTGRQVTYHCSTQPLVITTAQLYVPAPATATITTMTLLILLPLVHWFVRPLPLCVLYLATQVPAWPTLVRRTNSPRCGCSCCCLYTFIVLLATSTFCSSLCYMQRDRALILGRRNTWHVCFLV